MNSDIGSFPWVNDLLVAKLIFALCECRDDEACSSAEKFFSNEESSICHNLQHNHNFFFIMLQLFYLFEREGLKGDRFTCYKKKQFTWSPCSSCSRNPLLIVSSLSDTRPPQHLDRKQTAPVGVIPTNSFNVLWCLYVEYVIFRASKLDGRCMKISLQSIMTQVFLYLLVFLKALGRFLIIAPFSGHTIRNFRASAITELPMFTIFVTWSALILNLKKDKKTLMNRNHD